MLENNNSKKLISALLIFSIILPTVLFSAPKNAQAQPGTTAAFSVPVADIPQETAGWLSQALHYIGVPSTVMNTSLHIKDFAAWLLQQALMHAAKAALAKITQATINWINSDFHGSPLFLENPESFFKDIAKSEVRNMVDMIGYDSFRFPFGKQTALNVISSYKSQLETNAQYSLSKVINDPQLLVRYRNDFNYGGWNGFLVNTQFPQNNYLGFQSIVQQNLASRLEGTLVAPAQKVQQALQQGMGFLSPQTCPSNPRYNNGVNEFLKPSFTAKTKFIAPKLSYEDPGYLQANDNAIKTYNFNLAEEKATWAITNNCPGGLVNTTPGSVVGNQIMDAMGSNLRQTELGAALGNSLSAIFDALLNHFLDKGLNALASTVNSSAGEDNWSYEGQTLGDSYASPNTGSITELTIPEHVSVRVGQTTDLPILGGTGNYHVKTGPDILKATAEIITATSTSGVSSAKLRIAGKVPATASDDIRLTTVVVEDTRTKESVTVNISVISVGALAIIPTNCTPNDRNNFCISTDTNNPFIATIEGGTEPYSIYRSSTVKGPDEGIAIVTLVDNQLVVSGVNRGETFVIIKDSGTKLKRVDIRVESVADLNIPQDIQIAAGETQDIPILGGKAPYYVETVINASVATAKISQRIGTKEGSNPPEQVTYQVLEIKGITAGSSGVIIKDSSSPTKRASANITTSGSSTNNDVPRGSCSWISGRFDGDNIRSYTPNTTREECTNTYGGTWTQTTPKP